MADEIDYPFDCTPRTWFMFDGTDEVNVCKYVPSGLKFALPAGLNPRQGIMWPGNYTSSYIVDRWTPDGMTGGVPNPAYFVDIDDVGTEDDELQGVEKFVSLAVGEYRPISIVGVTGFDWGGTLSFLDTASLRHDTEGGWPRTVRNATGTGGAICTGLRKDAPFVGPNSFSTVGEYRFKDEENISEPFPGVFSGGAVNYVFSVSNEQMMQLAQEVMAVNGGVASEEDLSPVAVRYLAGHVFHWEGGWKTKSTDYSGTPSPQMMTAPVRAVVEVGRLGLSITAEATPLLLGLLANGKDYISLDNEEIEALPDNLRVQYERIKYGFIRNLQWEAASANGSLSAGYAEEVGGIWPAVFPQGLAPPADQLDTCHQWGGVEFLSFMTSRSNTLQTNIVPDVALSVSTGVSVPPY